MKLLTSALLPFLGFTAATDYHNCRFAKTDDFGTMKSREFTSLENTLFKRLEPIIGHVWKTYVEESADESYNYFLTICGKIEEKLVINKWNVNMGLTDHERDVLKHAGFAQAKVDSEVHHGNDDRVWSLGEVTHASIMGGTDWVKLSYSNGTRYHSHCNGEGRKTEVMVTCNPAAKFGKMRIIGEERESASACYYLIELESSVVCNAPSGFTGTIGNIVKWVFILALVYIAIGFLYNKLILKNSRIPHGSSFRVAGNFAADLCDKFFRTRIEQDGQIQNVGDQPGLGQSSGQVNVQPIDDNDDHLLPM